MGKQPRASTIPTTMKLILVSNRLPVRVTTGPSGPVIESSDGGLATAVGRAAKRLKPRWVGYLGDTIGPAATKTATEHGYFPVSMSLPVYDNYYSGYSNQVLWPVLHGFDPVSSPGARWGDYVRANESFATEVARLATPEDAIWIHDYHLFLLPELLRSRGLKNKIGFFLHTPFADDGFFQGTDQGRRLVKSLLQADTIGVQTRKSLERVHVVARGVGATVDRLTGSIRYLDRTLRSGTFPIGIDYRQFARRTQPAPGFQERLITKASPPTVLSLSRLDYTKGLPELLDAASLLARDPSVAGRFTLRLLVIPSRLSQPEYRSLREHIEQSVRHVNVTCGTAAWQPVEYQYGFLTGDECIAAYRSAKVFVAAPLADGMNLVAKEYLAANRGGTLVLGRGAGAAEQLHEAILVNANSPLEIAQAIKLGLLSPPSAEVKKRLRLSVKTANVYSWANDFLTSLRT